MKRSFIYFLLICCVFAYSADVVISEFATRGESSAYDEFVELYNTTCGDVDISGWTLDYWAGSSWGTKVTVPSNTTLASGQFYLIASINDYYVSLGSGPVADLYHTTYLGLADGTAGNARGLRIKNSGGTVIDTVMYEATGNTSHAEAEGGLTAPNHGTTANGNSVERKAYSNSTANDLASGGAHETDGNAYDSNVNYDDFVRQTNGRNPQNMSSTKETPPGCAGDNTPPQILSTVPGNNEIGVSLSQNIIIAFNEAMNTNSAEGAFSINPDVSGKVFSWNASDTQMTVSHNDFLQNTLYTVTISTAAQDVAGNGLDGNGNGSTGPNYVFSFTSIGMDGSGTCSVNPTSLERDTYNTFDFTYTAEVDLSGGQVRITIPANWTAPQTTNALNAGYTTISGGAGTTVSIASITGSGPWYVLIDTTTFVKDNTFTLKYGDTSGGGAGSTCNTVDNYTFTTQSKGSAGTLTNIATSPTINVFVAGAGDGSGTATLYYQDNDPIFAGGIGNYVYINFTPSGSADNYKVSVSVPANWGAPTSYFVDVLEEGATFLSKSSTYYTINGSEVIYDYYALKGYALSNPSYLQFRFKSFISSDSTLDNGFAVKSSGSPSSNPLELASSSPVEVNMTADRWYELYFNFPVDTAYRATPNLDASYTYRPFTGTGLDQEFISKINSAVNYVDGAFYTAGMQNIEDALKDGNFTSFRWWAEGDYWNSENNFHSDLRTKYGNTTVKNDNIDGSNSGLSHNKFILLDYDHATSAVKNTFMTGSWNINLSGTQHDAQNVIYMADYSAATLFKQEIDEFFSGRSGSGKTYAGSGTRDHLFSIGGGKKVQFGRNDNNVQIYMVPKDDAHSKIINAINSAESSIFFCIFTFTNDNIYNAIKNRWLAGVKVEGVFDAWQAGGTYSKYPDMVADGIPVKKDSISGLLHHKYMLIDADRPWSDPVVITGSANWTNATGLSGGNDENTFIIHDANLANEFYQEFRARYGASANDTPGNASIQPTTTAVGKTGLVIELTVTHNDSVNDNIDKISVFVSTSWTLPTTSNTLIRRGDGHFYSMNNDAEFLYSSEGTEIKLTCPSAYELLSTANGGTDANGKNKIVYKFSDFTAPSTTGPSVFSTKVDWASNGERPEPVEISPSPAIEVRPGIILVNEVYFKGDANTDWVELYCVDGGTSGMSIKDWTLNRGTGGTIDTDDPVKVFPDITMQTGEYMIIHWGGGIDDVNINDNTVGVWDVYTTATNIVATNEQIILKDNFNRYVDATCWASYSTGYYTMGETYDVTVLINYNQWTDEPEIGKVDIYDSINSDPLGAAWSIARSPNGFDSNSKHDWIAEPSPTKGAVNNVYNSIQAEILITEVAPDLGGGGETKDWIELYCKDDKNDGKGVDIGGLVFYDDSNPIKTVAAGTILKTGEFLLLRFDNLNVNYGPDQTKAGPNGTLYISTSNAGLTATDEDVMIRDETGKWLDYVLWTNKNGSYTDGVTVWLQPAIQYGEWKAYTAAEDPETIDDNEACGVSTTSSAPSKWSVKRIGYVDTNDKTDWEVENVNVTPGKPNVAAMPSGLMTVDPEKARTQQVINLVFKFNSEDKPIEYYYILVPTGWGDPSTFSINLSGAAGGSYRTDGQFIIVEDFSGGYLNTYSESTLTISTITTPTTPDNYKFTTGSRVVDGFPYEIVQSPYVTVLDAIIYINEVHFTLDSSSEDAFQKFDWIELYVEHAPVLGIDISGYTLSDLDGTDDQFGTSPMTVHTGDYVLVHFRRGLPDETDATGDTNGNGILDIYVESEYFGTEDQALLHFHNGTKTVYVDALAWSTHNNNPSSYELADVLELANIGQWKIKGSQPRQKDTVNSQGYLASDSLVRYRYDNDDFTDWQRTSTQTPGYANVITKDGSGSLAVSDGLGLESYYYNSTHNVGTMGTDLILYYTAQNIFGENGYVDVYKTAINDWSLPNTANISVSTSTNADISGFQILNDWKIRVYVNSMGINDTFALTLSNVTIGTQVPDYFNCGSKVESELIFFARGNPAYYALPNNGYQIRIDGPYTNGMMGGNTTTFTLRLCDEYGNYASTTDPNANLGITLSIDDFVADNQEDIHTPTTLTGYSDISGNNDTTVTGNLVNSQATVSVIVREPTSGQSTRTLRLTATDLPDILPGGVFTKDITVYPPISVKEAYPVYLSSSMKYKAFNVVFTTPFNSNTISDKNSYSLINGVTPIDIDSVFALTDNKTLRITTVNDLVPGETYTVTVYDGIKDGIIGNTIVLPISATFNIPYESGINISISSVNNLENTKVSAGKHNLFPVWNTNGTKIAYISNFNGASNIYTIDISDELNSPVRITENTENVLYFSHLSWGLDDKVYYAAYNSLEDRGDLYRRNADGSGNRELLSTGDYHNWFDPDHCPAAQQPGNVPRVVISAGGDLYVFNPEDIPPYLNPGSKMIKLTELSNEYDLNSSRCLQPRWWWAPAGYPDINELKIVFVYESRVDNSTQIYVINNIQNIISTAISEDTSTPSNMVTSFADARVSLITHKPGDAATPMNDLPKWAPTWSLGNNFNGAIISYVQDETGTFNNSVFNNISISSSVANSLSNSNFNTYMKHWDDPVLADDNDDINYVPQILGNNPYNEGFMNWSPAGGDKVSYISKIGDEYTVSILPIQTNMEIGPEGGILFDNSFTMVDVPMDSLMGNTMLSVSPPLSVPETTDDRMLETGEVREFYADGSGITFEKPVTMVIHYPDEDQDGYVDGTNIREENLKVWYYNSTVSPAVWELIGGEVDTVKNTLTIQVNHFSTYGLFGYKEISLTGLETVRIYPNPVKAAKSDKVVFDKLPEQMEKFDIYNIAGEKLISLEDLEVIQDPENSDKFTRIDWKMINSKGKNIASGVYILVITDKEGNSKYYKFAVIR